MILTTVCLSSNRSDIGHVAEFPLAVKKTASMYLINKLIPVYTDIRYNDNKQKLDKQLLKLFYNKLISYKLSIINLK